jgi:hypothetical protein
MKFQISQRGLDEYEAKLALGAPPNPSQYLPLIAVELQLMWLDSRLSGEKAWRSEWLSAHAKLQMLREL